MTHRIGILETGTPPGELVARWGTYGEMFQRFLGSPYRYSTFNVQAGDFPSNVDTCEAYFVTGSPRGVHDGDAWIETLKSFLRESAGRVPVIGFCFGHQILAETFGGRVTTSEQGWVLGMQTYDIHHRATWMDELPTFFAPASHRDQVITLPQGAITLASNVATPFAALVYPELRIVSFQCHPEFDTAYTIELIHSRRAIFSAAQIELAVTSLRAHYDSERVAGWLRNFIRPAPGTAQTSGKVQECKL